MATVNVTGTLQNASGQGVRYAVVRLSPKAASPGEAQAIGGVGILRDPVEALTNDSGVFSLPAVQGFQYTLDIPSIGFSRVFRAPSVTSVAFHTLGLSPVVSGAPSGVNEDGDTQAYVTTIVASEATVRERFDELVLERAAALDGPWSEVKRWTLTANKSRYLFTDEPTSNAVFYRAHYENSVSGDNSDDSDAFSAVEEAAEYLVISVDELKATYLTGVDLTDDSGTPFPESMFVDYIKAAVDQLSKELDIDIAPREIVGETHDHFAQDYGQWGFFKLHHWPILKVRSVSFQYPTMDSGVTIDLDWVILEEEGASGVIQIVPGRGSIADVLIIPGALMPLWSGATGRVPGIWHFNYRAGFELGSVPPLLKHVIGMAAAIGPLNIAGDLVAGAGIATKSISVPGLSQSIGTTASATNAGYGSRILEYQKEIKAAMPTLKAVYGKTMRMVVV